MIIRTKKKIQSAFTLLELLVAVSLMIVITGAIVIVFQNATRVFNLSEASINIFQNARAAFDIMGKELAAARNDGANVITVFPTSANPSQNLITFQTLTTFEDVNGNQVTDFALVSYRVVQINNQINGRRRWRLIRQFNNPSTGVQANDILCQFVTQDGVGNTTPGSPDIRFELGTFSANQWVIVADGSADDQDTDAGEIGNTNANAIRIIMNMTDAQSRIERTLSRVFWIAN